MSFIYVYNDGNGKFQFHRTREDGAGTSNPVLTGNKTKQQGTMCIDGSHQLSTQTFKVNRQCSGCLRKDLPASVKCTGCSFALCSPCCRANKIPEGENGMPTGATAGSSRTLSSADVEQKLEEPDFFMELLQSVVSGTVEPHQKDGLFPAGQTIQFQLVSSGRTKDLAERLSLFINSRLGAKENQVEHVTVKPDLDRAWAVLRSSDVLKQFKVNCGQETTFDLLDGWRVKWQVYVPPKARTVYRVEGIPTSSMADIFCASVRKLIEEQLKMSPSEIDLVVASEGSVVVVFAHGEYDVTFPRSLFLPDGKELKLVPTSARA